MRDGTDADDLRRAATGDEAAAIRLYRNYARRVFSLAYHMLGQAEVAEDVVQDAYLKLWKHGARLAEDGVQVRAWLMRVASNRCIDLKRKRREVLIDRLPDQPATSNGPARQLAERQSADIVAEAIAALPERQRLAVILTNQSGLSNAEAGKVLDISEQALESLLARARRRLRKHLEPFWGELLGEGRE